MASSPLNADNTIQMALTDADGGRKFVLPDGIDLSKLSLEQSGEDLILTGPDGFNLVVRGFFTGEDTPQLVTADGSVVFGAELEQLLPGAKTEISPGEDLGADTGGSDGEELGAVDGELEDIDGTGGDDGDLEDFELAGGDAGEVDPLGPEDVGPEDEENADGTQDTDGASAPTEPAPAPEPNVEPAPQALAASPQPQAPPPPPPPLAPPPPTKPIEVNTSTDADAPPSNTAPSAVNIIGVSVDEDGVSAGRLSAFDGDGNGLTFSLDGDGHPGHGSVTVAPDGTYAYTPDPDFSGADQFSFMVSDGRGGVSRGSVSFDVGAQADAPHVSATDAAGTETIAIDLDVAAHLSDTDGSETLSVEISGLPAGAVLSAGTDNADGSWTLTHGDLAGLSLTVPDGAKGTYSLSIKAIAEEAAGGEARTTTTFQLVVDPLMANSLDGNDANNTLRGTDANDAISGQGGNDSLYGRDGHDTLSGGSGNDRLHGDDGDDVISGGDGADRLYGYAGADELRGGDGADYIYADADDTVIDGGDGADRLYVVGTEGVSVDLAAASIELAYGAAGNDTFDGSDLTANTSLYGKAGDDTLSGGSGNDRLHGDDGDDVISGGDGADRLYGYAGADELRGGDGADYIYADADDTVIDGGDGADRLYVVGTEGVSVDLAAASIELAYGAAGNDTFDGANLTTNTSLYGKAGDDILTGGAGNDRLYGDDGDDVISGGDGADRLYGYAGADELRGGDGADYIYADADDTVIDGGDGADRLYVVGTEGVSVDLAAASIELAYGAAGNDTFDGANLTTNTSLYGKAGDDILTGGAGNDRLYGDDGDDVISGGDGADRLYGYAGADELRGGDGADYIYADADDTVIDGGDGADRLYVVGTEGVSVDLAAASIELAYGAAGNDTFDGANLTTNTSLYGKAGDDILTGGAGNDRLYGDDGDDVISGGDGADRLYGGAGKDTFIFGAADGQDRIYDFAGGDELSFEGAEFSTDSLRFLQTGNDTLISFDGIDGLSVRLSGVDADDLASGLSTDEDAIIVSLDAVG